MIAIIDYGLGNLGSIANMLRTIGARCEITGDKEAISRADKLVLPGVGAFDAGMGRLEESGLDVLVREQAATGKPVLGICLGMQLLGLSSEEGKKAGLGLIPFRSRRFDFAAHGVGPSIASRMKVPHMGWDVVDFEKDSLLTTGIEGRQRYYFVHSYHAVCEEPGDVLMTCDYGYRFAAAVSRDNVYGVQFHPEKSHDFGMRLLENFAGVC